MFQMPQVGDTQQHFCENCMRATAFVFIGAQTYPLRVAQKLNIAPTVYQWRCMQCHTTVTMSEMNSVA